MSSSSWGNSSSYFHKGGGVPVGGRGGGHNANSHGVNSSENLTVVCFTCGMPSSKEWAQLVQSRASGPNKEPFYPFLETLAAPAAGLLHEDGSTFLCAFCHALLEAQWDGHQGTPPIDRAYKVGKFICAVCGVETYRKRVRALPFQEFPFLVKSRQPGSITLGNNPLAVVCLDCSETLWAQSAEYDRWGLPVHKRHFNWMARPPPPPDSMEATVARLPSGETQLPRCPPTDPLVPPKRSEPMAVPEPILPVKYQRMSIMRGDQGVPNTAAVVAVSRGGGPLVVPAKSPYHHTHTQPRKGPHGYVIPPPPGTPADVPIVTVAPMSLPSRHTKSSIRYTLTHGAVEGSLLPHSTARRSSPEGSSSSRYVTYHHHPPTPSHHHHLVNEENLNVYAYHHHTAEGPPWGAAYYAHTPLNASSSSSTTIHHHTYNSGPSPELRLHPIPHPQLHTDWASSPRPASSSPTSRGSPHHHQRGGRGRTPPDKGANNFHHHHHHTHTTTSSSNFEDEEDEEDRAFIQAYPRGRKYVRVVEGSLAPPPPPTIIAPSSEEGGGGGGRNYIIRSTSVSPAPRVGLGVAAVTATAINNSTRSNTLSVPFSRPRASPPPITVIHHTSVTSSSSKKDVVVLPKKRHWETPPASPTPPLPPPLIKDEEKRGEDAGAIDLSTSSQERPPSHHYYYYISAPPLPSRSSSTPPTRTLLLPPAPPPVLGENEDDDEDIQTLLEEEKQAEVAFKRIRQKRLGLLNRLGLAKKPKKEEDGEGHKASFLKTLGLSPSGCEGHQLEGVKDEEEEDSSEDSPSSSPVLHHLTPREEEEEEEEEESHTTILRVPNFKSSKEAPLSKDDEDEDEDVVMKIVDSMETLLLSSFNSWEGTRERVLGQIVAFSQTPKRKEGGTPLAQRLKGVRKVVAMQLKGLGEVDDMLGQLQDDLSSSSSSKPKEA